MEPPDWFAEPTFGQRVLARLLDGVVVLVPLLLLRLLPGAGTVVGSIVLVGAYETLLVATSGQTVGKKVLHVKVVDAQSGELVSTSRALVRWALFTGISAALALALSPVPAWIYDVVVFGMVLRPQLHRGPHDYAAGTVVTVAP